MGDYSATIAWGDGGTSAGTITVSGGVFTVQGSQQLRRTLGEEELGERDPDAGQGGGLDGAFGEATLDVRTFRLARPGCEAALLRVEPAIWSRRSKPSSEWVPLSERVHPNIPVTAPKTPMIVRAGGVEVVNDVLHVVIVGDFPGRENLRGGDTFGAMPRGRCSPLARAAAVEPV